MLLFSAGEDYTPQPAITLHEAEPGSVRARQKACRVSPIEMGLQGLQWAVTQVSPFQTENQRHDGGGFDGCRLHLKRLQ